MYRLASRQAFGILTGWNRHRYLAGHSTLHKDGVGAHAMTCNA